MGEIPEDQKKLPFDEAIVAKLRDVIHELLTDHPELRTVGIVLDYQGALNDAPIKAGLWIGDNANGVNEPAAIAGSIHQTMKLLVQQVSRMGQLEQGMREELAIVGQEVVRKHQELAALRGETPGETSGEEKEDQEKGNQEDSQEAS